MSNSQGTLVHSTAGTVKVSHQTLAKRATRNSRWAILLAFIACGVAGLALSPWRPGPETRVQILSRLEQAALTQEHYRSTSDLAYKRSHLLHLAQRLTTAFDRTDSLDEYVKRWNDLNEGILDSDDGMRIASDPASVRTFAEMRDAMRSRRPHEPSNTLRQRLHCLFDPIESAIESQQYFETDEAFARELDAVETEIQSHLDAYRQACQGVELLINTSPADDHSGQTLREALRQMVASEFHALTTQLDSQMQDAQADDAARLGKVMRHLERVITEAKERVVDEHALFLEAAISPKVQLWFRVFTIHGRSEIAYAGGWNDTSTFGSVSLSRLQKSDILTYPTAFVRAVTNPGRDREKYRWDIPEKERDWTSEHIVRIREAMALLKRLGPTMVELGMLAP